MIFLLVGSALTLPAWQPNDIHVGAGSRSPVEAGQEESATLTVQTRTPDGQPLKGATVTLTWEKARNAVVVSRKRTDSTGNFECKVPRDTVIQWIVQAPHPGQIKSGTLTVPADRPSETLPVIVHTGDDAMYTAIFVDAETMEPIPAVKVELFTGDEGLRHQELVIPPRQAEIVGDRFGRVELPAATWRSQELLVFAEGYAFTYLPVGGSAEAPGLDQPQRIPLPKEVTIQVDLIDSGLNDWVRASVSLHSPGRSARDLNALMAAHVTLSSEPTGEDGQHIIRGLPELSNAKLHLMRSEAEFRQLEELKTEAAGRDMRRTYDCWSRGKIHGTLGVSPGHSAEDRVIHLLRVKDGRYARMNRRSKVLASARTSPKGAFRFDELSEGHYYVVVGDKSAAPGGINQVSTAVSVRISSDSPRADVGLEEVPGVFISGSLLDENGKPSNGQVVAQSDRDRVLGRPDKEGKFRLGPFLPKEAVRLMASPVENRWSATRPESLSVTAPAEGLEIRFEPAGMIKGHLSGFPGAAFRHGITIDLKTEGRSVSAGGAVENDGTFSIGHLSPGTYRVTASQDNGRKSAIVEVEICASEVTGGVELTLPDR